MLHDTKLFAEVISKFFLFCLLFHVFENEQYTRETRIRDMQLDE